MIIEGAVCFKRNANKMRDSYVNVKLSGSEVILCISRSAQFSMILLNTHKYKISRNSAEKS